MKSINEVIHTINRPEKILQFGEGNFLRAFVDWMIDISNEKTNFNANTILVQPLNGGLAEKINAQNGLYTTVLRGVQDGKTVEELRTITSVSRCINPYSNFENYIECAKNTDLRFVVSNTTEAGIAYNPQDSLDDKPQSSFPGKVTAFLYQRFKHFNGDTNKGLIFIPCELIDKNGDKLKEFVMQYSHEWKLSSEFISWVEQSCYFCNSLVDRIVPGYPKEEAQALCEKIGYHDDLLDAAEIFHLWVIESSKDFSKELPLAQSGLNVIWTNDMSFYRTRKVRILNGAHTMTVLAAFLYGLNTVEECINDSLIYSFMKKGIFEEIIPSMDGDTEQLKKYAHDVLERFANPYIKHLLISISLNSVSKFKTRVLPSIVGYIKKYNTLPDALCFSLAALIAFYKGNFSNGELIGTRNNDSYPIKDDKDVLDFFEKLYKEVGNLENNEKAFTHIAHAVLSVKNWWGEDLTLYKDLEYTVAKHLKNIFTSGIKNSIDMLIMKGK